MKIAIFYGSTTCYTEMAGEKIQQQLEVLLDTKIDMFNIENVALSRSQEYDFIIFGISTWDFGELQEDWESSWDDIKSLQLSGKTVALYGLGDQLGYADWFQDALGMLHDALIPLQVDVIGFWPTAGYEYTASKAEIGDGEFFVGLSLDDENQYDETDDRIEHWCNQLVEELHQINT